MNGPLTPPGELPGDCFTFDEAPSGAVDTVWYTLDELAAAICFDGCRTPPNLWGRPGGGWPVDLLPELDNRVVALLAEYVRDGGRVPHSLRQDL